MTNRTLLRWGISFGLAASSLVFGACFHIGDQTGTCAPGNVCTCDGIGNCHESCPTGNCNFSCTGVGNCDVTCEGGGCSLSCSGTGNCNLDCSGGNCTSNCIGRTNCVCTNCSDLRDAGPLSSDTGVDAPPQDTGPRPDANDDAWVPEPTDANADIGPDA